MGAVYIPDAEMLPPLAVQLTAVLVAPLTLAVNCWLLPTRREAELGFTATETIGAVVAEPEPYADTLQVDHVAPVVHEAGRAASVV